MKRTSLCRSSVTLSALSAPAMFTPRLVFTPLILFSWILPVSLSPVAEGEVRVVGPSEPVTAHVGDEVVLPCRCDRPTDLTPLTVEWSRAELRPKPSDRQRKVLFVHMYIHHRNDDPDMKISDFVNRTRLVPGQLAEGVASLRILNVSLSDSGTYKCFIPNLPTDNSLQWTHVTLVVNPSVEAVTPAPHPDPGPSDSDSSSDRGHVVKVIVFVIFGVFCVTGLVLLKITDKRQKQKENGSQQNTTLRECQDLVTVPVEDEKKRIPQRT